MAKFYIDIEKKVAVRVEVNAGCREDAVTKAMSLVADNGVDEYETIDSSIDEYNADDSSGGIYDKDGDHGKLVDYIKENCELKHYFVEWAWDCIGEHDSIPVQVYDIIDNAVCDWAIDHDIDKETIDDDEDIEDLFMECFSSDGKEDE